MLCWVKNHWMIITLATIMGIYIPLSGHVKSEVNYQNSLSTLKEVINLIKKQSIIPPETDLIITSTISGMLDTLDPYSYYINDNQTYILQDEDNEIIFSIGCDFICCSDGIVITSITKDSSIDKFDIQIGDIITAIDDQRIDCLTQYDILQKLNGNQNTTVKLSIKRYNIKEPFIINVIRDKQLSNNVRHCMLDTNIGFIKIKSFKENTAKEFAQSVQNLKREGMKSIILDLRDNPGGSLNAAMDICKQLLNPNDLIITQIGRNKNNIAYYNTQNINNRDQLPIVLLINNNTASAPEVVAGSIQDHDRGLIVGQQSWGKGLIQRKIRMGYNKYLLISNSRYLTPSGRCIHKYHKYYDDNYHNYNRICNKEVCQQKIPYKTDLGRTVYSNSGITPDYIVDKSEGFSFINNSSDRLSAFYRFANINKAKYMLKPEQNDSSVVKDFKKWISKQKIKINKFEIYDIRNQKDILSQLNMAIKNAMRCDDDNIKFQIVFDSQVKKAMEIMPKALSIIKYKNIQ